MPWLAGKPSKPQNKALRGHGFHLARAPLFKLWRVAWCRRLPRVSPNSETESRVEGRQKPRSLSSCGNDCWVALFCWLAVTEAGRCARARVCGGVGIGALYWLVALAAFGIDLSGSGNAD
ncbi:hypothetical protein BaRGS_00012921 [Batillaria attramentaria]|uniref:Uncharacterized protein n=1 Tax=Batillaria attramentaria TaxID=370345 RepID=A0ABD0L9F7_9CAEN